MLRTTNIMNAISKKIQVARDTENADFEEKTLWYYPSNNSYALYIKNLVVWSGFGASSAAREYNKY